jgi:pyruvate, water dikinase
MATPPPGFAALNPGYSRLGKIAMHASVASQLAAPAERFIVPLDGVGATDASRVGPKAANLAALARAGLPTPGGFCLAADAYLAQVTALGLDDVVSQFAAADPREQRKLSVEIRLALYEQPIMPDILTPLRDAWHAQRAASGKPCAVRSSALIEDRRGANFAGQFESFLGIDDEAALLTAVRACWAALWTTNARRYMDNHGLSPAGTAMAVLIQPLVDARASGGGLSENAEGQMLLSATWGLGSAIAQGEVVPDRIVLTRQGFLRTNEAGRKHHADICRHGTSGDANSRARVAPQAMPRELVDKPCLDAGEAVALGRLLRKAEAVLGMAVEIEWALDDGCFKLLQARPLPPRYPPPGSAGASPASSFIGARAGGDARAPRAGVGVVPDEIWLKHPGLNGHPAGIGWGSGPAVVVNCECELSRIAPGDILVTRVAGPALSHVLPRVAGVVAELGGSTSHLASLARERGIPMVLGVHDATRKIPDGAQVAVDGVTGVVRWIS